MRLVSICSKAIGPISKKDVKEVFLVTNISCICHKTKVEFCNTIVAFALDQDRVKTKVEANAIDQAFGTARQQQANAYYRLINILFWTKIYFCMPGGHSSPTGPTLIKAIDRINTCTKMNFVHNSLLDDDKSSNGNSFIKLAIELGIAGVNPIFVTPLGKWEQVYCMIKQFHSLYKKNKQKWKFLGEYCHMEDLLEATTINFCVHACLRRAY